MADAPPDGGAVRPLDEPAAALGDRPCCSSAPTRSAPAWRGLGIRYLELARVLADHAHVVIAHTGAEDESLEGIQTVAYRPHVPGRLKPVLLGADFVVAQPQWPLINRWLRGGRSRVIFDVYDPETFETLELIGSERPLVRRAFVDLTLDRLHDALRTGHHFMCATEKQRDLWLGAMLGLRLIAPGGYDRDPSLRSVIDTVPFGLPSEPPAPAPDAGPRGRLANVDEDERARALERRHVELAGPCDRGTRGCRSRRAPSPSAPGVHGRQRSGSRRPWRARPLTRSRASWACYGSVVHFHETWVPYDERGAWLAQADCAISTHAEHLETRFAFRTRLLDCFWSGLPVVCTEGDDLADRVAREDLGGRRATRRRRCRRRCARAGARPRSRQLRCCARARRAGLHVAPGRKRARRVGDPADTTYPPRRHPRRNQGHARTPDALCGLSRRGAVVA